MPLPKAIYDRLNWILSKVQYIDMSEWEQEFVDSMIGRVERYGTRTMVSEKQWTVLDDLARRIE